jgi:hypothetical protein
MEWETLTAKQQEAVLKLLAEAAEEIADQYEAELTRLQQPAERGRILAQRDLSGLSRQPVPPVPDVKRDSAYEKLVLDTHRLVTYFAYLNACQAHLSSQGFDIGVGSGRSESLCPRVAAGSQCQVYGAVQPGGQSVPGAGDCARAGMGRDRQAAGLPLCQDGTDTQGALSLPR